MMKAFNDSFGMIECGQSGLNARSSMKRKLTHMSCLLVFRVCAVWIAIGALATLAPAQRLGPFNLTAQADGFRITPTDQLLVQMNSRGPIRLESVQLGDGSAVDLDLEPVSLRSPRVTLRNTAGRKIATLPSPRVSAFSGRIVGEPDSRAFIGWDGHRLHGWIQSQAGLDVIAATPGEDASTLYRVGAAPGAKPPPAHHVDARDTSAPPLNEYGRLLMALSDEALAGKSQLTAEGIAELVERAATREVGVYEELGGCCISPGFCFFIDEAMCGQFCDNPVAVTCDELGPSIDAPCWLGPDVGCDTRWACYEENDEGGWVGACCFPDPDDPSYMLLEDKAACECALLGGTFLIEPANCLSGLPPQDYPADRFISADVIEELDPEACIKPSGACCIDQDLLCLPDQPDLPIPLDQVTCMMLPQALCESDDPKVLTALNASTPGIFTKECFPCVYDTAASGVYSDAPPICSMFTVEREDPENDDYTAVQLLEPVNFRCAPLQVTLEMDAWVPDLFAEPGDDAGFDAATGYVTLLFAAVADLYAQEAGVPLVLTDLVVQAREDIPFGDGACCYSSLGYCWEHAYQEPCESTGGTWLGHGSSCFSPSDCEDNPVYGNNLPMSIDYVLDRLVDRWTISGACCLDDETCMDLSEADCDAEGGTFTPDTDCGGYDCEEGTGTYGYSMIIAVAAGPFLNPYFPEFGAVRGVYDPRGVVQEVGGVCRPYGRFGVAPIRGGFAPPPESNELGNAQWDLVMLTQVVTRLIGVSPTDDYGYDDCYTRLCRGMGARVDCDLYWSDPMAWALGDMASTIMSNCLACEGGLANLQIRFRSEIASRIYATAAAAPCAAEGELNEESVSEANDDVFAVAAIGPSTLDVLFNDVPAGCQLEISSDPIELSNTEAFPMPSCSSDPTTGTMTEQGGWACGDEDIDGYEFVRYTPPADFCGVDRFIYALEDSADDAFATVSVVSQGNTSFAGECAVSHAITCDPDCVQSDGEASDLPVPPVAGAANVIVIDAAALASTRVSTIRWQDAQLEVLVATSAPAHATMRFWFTSTSGSTDLDVYWDIIPYGDTIAIQCLDGPVPLGLGGGVPGVQSPVSGVCDSPSSATLLYVPDDGQVLVQCFEQLDEDPTQSDAQWLGGTLCLGGSEVGIPGACCLGGLCIEATPSECASLGYAYDPFSETWVEDPIASGFFMGQGTSCSEQDWCSREAPCCLETECVTVSTANCAALGGIVLRGGYGPLYDTPCAFTVCRMGLETQAKGACCITADSGLRFCVDLTLEECGAIPRLAPPGTHWEADWQIRATCAYTPCGSVVMDNGGGDGACCFPGACCTLSLTDEDCGIAGGIWLPNGSCDDCLSVQHGVCCIGAQGPLTQGSLSACADDVSQAACTLMGGTWIGGLENCTDAAPCAPWIMGDACCIQGICLNVSTEDCNLAGGRAIRGLSCSDAGVCALGVCCVDGVQMPGTDELGLAFDAIDESRCTLWGGRWIGSGDCIFTHALDGADLDGDGRVGTTDLLILLAAWGDTSGKADLDGDGRVGLHDLLTLVSNWSPSNGP